MMRRYKGQAYPSYKMAALQKRLSQERANHARQLVEKDAECERLRNALATKNLLQHVQQSADLEELLTALGTQLFSLPNVSGGGVNLVNEYGDALITAHLVLPEEFKSVQKTHKGHEYPLHKDDVNVVVFKSEEPALVTSQELEKYAEETRMRFERLKMRSLLVVPLAILRNDGTRKTIGVVSVFSQDHLLDLRLAAKIQEISAIYTTSIKLHWARHQAVEFSRTVRAMYAEIEQFIAYITEMNSLTDVDEVYSLIAKQFIKRFQFDMAGILLEENSELAIVHTEFSQPFLHLAKRYEPFRKKTRYSLSVCDGATSLVFANNQRYVFPDAMELLHLPMSDKDKASLALLETPRTLVLVPIRLNGVPMGVLWLGSLAEPIELPEETLALIELLASFVSTAIRNAQAHGLIAQQNNKIEMLNKDLQSKIVLLDQVARKDRLTGLNNFGHFDEELKRRTSEYALAADGEALSVILIDVDHFKRFNDTYGHTAGNQVLQEVGRRISANVRDVDFVARFGGEEFVILLPQCDQPNALIIAERIRRKVAEDAFFIDGYSCRVTVSGGCTQFLPHESGSDFVRRADAALYAAKHKGRNRIEQAAAIGNANAA